MDDEVDELVTEFLIESFEGLDALDAHLVVLETDPTSGEHLGSIFRTVHSIKGTCGFLGFDRLAAVAHTGENLLSQLRDGSLLLDGEITSGLLAMFDRIRELLSAVESGGGEPPGDDSALLTRLTLLQAGSTPAAAPAAAAAEAADTAGTAGTAGTADTAAAGSQGPATEAAEVGAQPEPATDPVPAAAAVADPVPDGPAPAAPRSAATDATIRVSVTLLDRMMNLVGELVLARNQVLQQAQQVEDVAFVSTAQRLNLVTSELQEEVTKARMQPIGGVWARIPRVVRTCPWRSARRSGSRWRAPRPSWTRH